MLLFHLKIRKKKSKSGNTPAKKKKKNKRSFEFLVFFSICFLKSSQQEKIDIGPCAINMFPLYRL